MQVIYKYPVHPRMKLRLPADAAVLTVQVQHGEAQMWVLLDPEAPTVTRHFAALATGESFPPTLTRADYIATFQSDGGLVFHVFETTRAAEE